MNIDPQPLSAEDSWVLDLHDWGTWFIWYQDGNKRIIVHDEIASKETALRLILDQNAEVITRLLATIRERDELLAGLTAVEPVTNVSEWDIAMRCGYCEEEDRHTPDCPWRRARERGNVPAGGRKP